MKFQDLAAYFERLEATSKRLEMFDILADLFRQTSLTDIKPVVYMLQGLLLPAFEGLEIGMSDKLLARGLAQASEKTLDDVLIHFNLGGDPGKTAEKLLAGREGEGLTVKEVYGEFLRIARTSGEGSVEKKLCNLADLLTSVSSKEARYIARFVMGRLLLGAGDVTILEAMAVAKLGILGKKREEEKDKRRKERDKEIKKELEQAYNRS